MGQNIEEMEKTIQEIHEKFVSSIDTIIHQTQLETKELLVNSRFSERYEEMEAVLDRNKRTRQ